MELLRGTVRNYAWGDPAAIPELLGVEPDGRPWAEMWFGTHPGGPTVTADGRPLAQLAGVLPFLVKFLAAAQPLSIQTHPNAEQARRGYAREEAAALALDDPVRNYRDASAKPEVLVALTEFEALCGFRPFDETAEWFADQGWHQLAVRLSDGPAAYLRWALATPAPQLPAGAPQWATRIATRHPGDGGVLVALLLNHVTLSPGQAIYLTAGNLHAYLKGTGLEVMGASDNVIRGGLSSKHVDVDELLAIVDVHALADPLVQPRSASPGLWVYDTPGSPFRVERHDIDGVWRHTSAGPEIVVCTSGSVGELHRGDVAYLGAGEHIESTSTAPTVVYAVAAA